MKRITMILLAIVMLFSLTACGEFAIPGSSNQKTPFQSESHNNNKETSKPKDNDNNRQTPSPSKKPDNPEKNEFNFTEVVAVDNEECSIKITGIKLDSFFDLTLKVLFVNKSAEKKYMYSVKNAAINGIQQKTWFATEVPAGKKSNNSIIFLDNTLKKNNIVDYTDIELTFIVYDSNDILAEYVADETVHIYPYGKDKAVKFQRASQPNDNVIIDNEYVTVIVTGYEQNSEHFAVQLFIVNKTDQNITFSVRDTSLNGFMADPFYATEVRAGKCEFSNIFWLYTVLKNNEITTVEEIEFEFVAYDWDSMSDDYFADEIITLKP